MERKQYNRVTEQVIEELRRIVGEKHVWSDRSRLEEYSHDEVTDSRYQHIPEVVVRPGNAGEISKIVKLANREVIPVVPRGAGTGLSAGVAPMLGGIVLLTERLNHIIEVNSRFLYMIVEPGVRTVDVQEAANHIGLVYAGDPCSSDSCFIGGNIATNAGGNRAVRYGTTRAQIYFIEVVTPQGDIVQLGSLNKKNSTGYCLEQLIMGSEGTLGIITKACLKLVDMPAMKVDLLGIFPNASSAIDSVMDLLKSSIDPLSLEYMDNLAIKVVAAYLKETLPHQEDGEYLIITVDGDSEDELDDKVMQVDEICRRHHAIETLTPDSKKIWHIRKSVEEGNREISLIHISEDTVVPLPSLPETMAVIPEICRKYHAIGHLICHAGDGNMHLAVLQGDIPIEEWPQRVDQIMDEIYKYVYSVGGLMSGEHGVGTKRLKWMEKYTNPIQLELMKAIKKALDPNLILNPGTIFTVNE
jgi:glycolate oxidase